MAEVTGKKRWLPVALGLSLALNLAVVAAVSGAALRHKGGDKGGPPRASKGGAIYLQAMPRDLHKNIWKELKQDAPPPRSDPAAMVVILRQEPFNPAAAAGILNAERDVGLSRMQAMSGAWLAQITAMSVAEREAYTDRLQELIERRDAHKKERKGD